jgi:glycosyltransferase involved in cell wall biosynthesis
LNASLFDHPPAAAPATRVDQPLLNLGAPRGQERSVLFALPFLTFGGAEALFRNAADWAKKAGWTPLVITTLDLPEMPKDPACFAGVTERVYPLATLFRSNEERLAFVQYLIRRYRVRVLVLGGSEAAYHWLPAIKAAHPNVAIVDHLFNSDSHVYNNRHYAESINVTVVQSEKVLEDIQRQLGKPAGEVRRIPLGVEIPAEQALPKSGEEITIGYFGRLSLEKGPDLFVQIAKRIADRHAGVHPSLRFILAGDGPARETVHKLVRGAESFIEMPGFVKEVRSLMSRADIVVLPSRIDGMPAAVLEAQALGIPVVASRVGGMPEMIVDGETGYLCAAGDVEMFCARIEDLIRDAELRKRIGTAARRSVEEKHSIGAMKTRYLELLDELA